MLTEYSPLTWGIYNNPPPDIPECGFVGELCLPPVRGKESCLFNTIDVKLQRTGMPSAVVLMVLIA